jgi:hypothetical protein
MSSRLSNLEIQVKELEDKIRRLLLLVDHDKDPFVYLTLEMNLTRDQIMDIYALMDQTDKSLSSGNPMHHAEFERRVHQIVPQREGDYHFAENIVRTLNTKGFKYKAVYKHLKESGMNLT